MATTYVETIELTTMSCSCGGVFAISEEFRRQRKADGGHWFCPYCGNQRVYRKSDVQALKEQVESLQHSVQWANDDAKWQRRQRERAERSLVATKGVVTRIKNRVSKGVCPCCNRYFADLHRHMERQHPDYANTDA